MKLDYMLKCQSIALSFCVPILIYVVWWLYLDQLIFSDRHDVAVLTRIGM